MLFTRKRKDHMKVFVIGHNKTGTTSIGRALSDLGYRLGSQPEAERLIEDWAQRNFHSIVNYCKTADAFQDIPFSFDYTYQAMDYAFPGSKFILTIRKNGEEWYESLTRFHSKIVGKGRLPTADDLKQYSLNGKGWLWRAEQVAYGINERTLYDKELYIQFYEMHNKRVKDYFRYRQDDLLVLNLSDSNSMDVLCRFLGKPVSRQRMPHLNKSAT
ncbi:MAG: hypothetical protein BMS9Abin33_0456 [Gammaproteobacteria bacterium]|nr:MAG: hypothetical protein BMS9Abin33_0456 [Gammaproteobacteria bacterium]